MKKGYYAKRCDFLDNLIECQQKLINKSIETLKNQDEVIKEQDNIIKCLEEYNDKLKNDIQEMTIENDTLREKCEKNNVEIG